MKQVMHSMDILDTIADHGGTNRGAVNWDWASFQTGADARACYAKLKEGGVWLDGGVLAGDPENPNENFRRPCFRWRRD